MLHRQVENKPPVSTDIAGKTAKQFYCAFTIVGLRNLQKAFEGSLRRCIKNKEDHFTMGFPMVTNRSLQNVSFCILMLLFK